MNVEEFQRAGFNMRDNHRKQYTDIEWALAQPTGPAKYMIGDVVEFRVGGFGIIDEVCHPHNGWPASYSVARAEGKPFHAKGITAWHYEGDFKELVGKSALRGLAGS